AEAEAKALEKAGYEKFEVDTLTGKHTKPGFNILSYRSPGAKGTGAGSGHFVIHQPVTQQLVMGVGENPLVPILVPVPGATSTEGTVHFGEHNLKYGFWEHMKELYNSWRHRK